MYLLNSFKVKYRLKTSNLVSYFASDEKNHFAVEILLKNDTECFRL